MYKRFFLIFPAFMLVNNINAQEKSIEKFKHNQVGLLLSHTSLRQGNEDSDNDVLFLPSFTLFYNYHFNEKWQIGLHTDFVNEQFVAKSSMDDENVIQREKPIAPAVMVGYKPNRHFTFMTGAGLDFDSEETLGLLRFDIEYGAEISNDWEFLATVGYDIRFNAYGSFQIGVGVGKNF